MHDVLATLLDGHPLSRAATRRLFDAIIAGELDHIHLTAALVALKMRGESADIIAGAAEAMRAAATDFPRPDYLFADIVGTGGDNVGTINISTAASFVTAAAGLPVAKHGNRSVSSQSGAADVMERLGCDLTMPPSVARQCLDDAGVTFLFAPHYHAGMRHVMPVRQALRTRTIFNILGPLANPAAPSVMLVGVYDDGLRRTFAETLQLMGCEKALVVHGLGLDEIALHGATNATLLRDGEVTDHHFTPRDFGVDEFPLERLKGGGPDDNTRIVCDILTGNGDPAHTTAVCVNSAATLYLAGVASTLPAAYELAYETVLSGAPAERADRFAQVSSGRTGACTSGTSA